MGVKFGREYAAIINDLSEQLEKLEGCHEFLEMEAEEWIGLTPEERRECLKAVADDVFYGLGAEPSLSFGEHLIIYDRGAHEIRILTSDDKVAAVSLI